jgi:hypothetical protein
MATKKKPAPEANRGTGYGAAFDSRNHSPIHFHLKALLIGIAAHDAALLALLALVLWGALL